MLQFHHEASEHPNEKVEACQAFIKVNGRFEYLGKWGTPKAVERYNRRCAELQASRVDAISPMAGWSPGRISVNEMVLAYWQHAEVYYCKHGKPTSEITNLKYALRPLCEIYGSLEVSEFGPSGLEVLRESMIRRKLSRGVINERINQIRRVFKWGTSKGLVPAMIWHALQSLDGLKAGRSKARETEPVLPIDGETVEATIPWLPAVVADMVRFQRLTGCRPGEVCGLRPCDVDRGDEVWAYRPASHKTEHHGRERIIFVGPRAQAILLQYLDRPADRCCFSPADSERVRLAELRLTRKSKLTPSQLRRGVRASRRRLADQFSKDAYNRSIRRGIDRLNAERLSAWLQSQGASAGRIRRIVRALDNRPEVFRNWAVEWLGYNVPASGFVPRWRPNQLRHSAATEIRRKFGVEMSRVVLGHSEIATTQIYAERDLAAAAAVMREIG